MGDRVGVLLMNSGTPDEPTEESIRSFLAEMLMDRHLVNVPRPIWKLILNHSILPSRPAKTLPRYRAIWTAEGMPLHVISERQRSMLEGLLHEDGHDADVAFAMNYGNPRLPDALQELCDKGCSRLIVIPLYPQYARVTTQACIDHVEEELARSPQGWRPRVEYVHSYCDRAAYLDELAGSIAEAFRFEAGSKLLFSYHSTLVKDIERGDPYKAQVEQTSRDVASRLGLSDGDWAISWQCRFDSRKWLMPTPETVLEDWAGQGVSRVAVVCPVFSADCVETLYDCEVEQKGFFEETYARLNPASAEKASYIYVPALNARPGFISMLAGLSRRCSESTLNRRRRPLFAR